MLADWGYLLLFPSPSFYATTRAFLCIHLFLCKARKRGTFFNTEGSPNRLVMFTIILHSRIYSSPRGVEVDSSARIKFDL